MSIKTMNEPFLSFLSRAPAEEWNAWRMRHTEVPRLAHSTFRGVDFRGHVFDDMVFRHTRFLDCRFHSVNITGTDFSDCSFDNVHFSNSVGARPNFTRSFFDGGRLSDCKFPGMCLFGLQAKALVVQDSELRRGSAGLVHLERCDISRTDLRYTSFTQGAFHRCKFSTCDFGGTEFPHDAFKSSTVEFCDFSGSDNIPRTHYYPATLQTAVQLDLFLSRPPHEP